MKKIKFIALALALTLGSCMGDGYADPDLTEKVPASPWGNNSLREKNVISIADLKTQFATVINSDNGYKLIEKDMMIKAVVTGNDVSGNIYNRLQAYRMHPAQSSLPSTEVACQVIFLLVRRFS